MVDVLAVVAHPDDAAIFCGGTIAKHADRGDEVAIVYLTRGELGGLEGSTTTAVASTREAEAAAGADVLGVETVDFLGYADGRLQATLDARMDVVETLRRYEPRVVLTHDRRDPHPDHVATATLVAEAYYMASLPLAPVEGEPHDPDNVYHFGKLDAAFEATTFVDIEGYLDRKLEAIAEHDSQAGFMAAHDGIDGAWDDLVEDTRAAARLYGSRAGVRYAEGFSPLHERSVAYLE